MQRHTILLNWYAPIQYIDIDNFVSVFRFLKQILFPSYSIVFLYLCLQLNRCSICVKNLLSINFLSILLISNFIYCAYKLSHCLVWTVLLLAIFKKIYLFLRDILLCIMQKVWNWKYVNIYTFRYKNEY